MGTTRQVHHPPRLPPLQEPVLEHSPQGSSSVVSLFVPLDVDYASDEKVIAAGPMAELLFVRALAFSKRTLSDGRIRKAQLPVVAYGITGQTKLAARLVHVGLWVTAEDGWQISGWSKRNKSAAAIADGTAKKRVAGQKANHERWHHDGRTSDECPFCVSDSDSDSDIRNRPVGVRSESTESETESETEPQQQTSESEPDVELVDSAAVDIFDRAAGLLAEDEVRAKGPKILNPGGYIHSRTPAIRKEHEANWRGLLEREPGLNAQQLASFVVAVSATVTADQSPVLRQVEKNRDCPTCNGVGVFELDDGTFTDCSCKDSRNGHRAKDEVSA